MTSRKRVRTLTGGLAVLTLLGLVVADTMIDGIRLSAQNRMLLVGLISALLGVDFALERWAPAIKGATAGAVEALLDQQTDRGRDDDE